MKKRFIALLLCCVMLLTLSPSLIASVAADDDANGTTVETPAEPKAEDSTVEEPKIEEPKIEEPKVEEPKAEDETTIPAAEQSDAPVASEIIAPTVNFTNVAPFLAPVTGTSPQQTMLRTMAYSARANNETPDSGDNGMVINKTATANGDGSYTITLEAYATGKKVITEVTEDIPTDIVLVLDQSGSMADPIGTVSFSAYSSNRSTNSRHYARRHNGGSANLYYPLENGTYAPVSVTVQSTETYLPIDSNTVNYANYGRGGYYYHRENLYAKINGTPQKVTLDYEYDVNQRDWVWTYVLSDGTQIAQSIGNDLQPSFSDIVDGNVLYQLSVDESQNVYTYTYTDTTGVTQTIGTSTGADTQFSTTLYQRVINTNAGGSRLNALKTAVTSFTNAVAEKAAGKDGDINTTEDNINHRVAVVGFASSGDQYNDDKYENTEVFVGATQYTYGTSAQSQYGNALQSMDTAAGKNNITSSIGALDAYGGTFANLGMEMANGIFENNPITNGQNRNRVIIVFTDGYPGTGTTVNSTVANNAVSQGYIAKQSTANDGYGATVYTVGIFSGADGTPVVSLNGVSDPNKFMHLLSSNYKNAQSYSDSSKHGTATYPAGGDSYYLSAADADSLNSIFQQISDQIETGGSGTTLSEETVIKDIVAPTFTLPEGATASDITLETWKYNGPENEWTKNADAMGATAAIGSTDTSSAVTTDNQISVTGFDFAENYVGTVTENGSVSYCGNKLVIRFKVTPRPGFFGGNGVATNTSAGVYENSTATEPVLTFQRPVVDVPLAEPAVTVPDANVYLGAYYSQTVPEDAVKMGATVKIGGYDIDFSKANDPDHPYGLEPWQVEYVTISISAAATGNGGSFENIQEDITYTVTVTVAPKTQGSSGDQKATDTGEGTIYVFRPQLTFRDSEVWYGGDAPADFAGNLAEETWVNSDGTKKHDDEGVQMLNAKPTLALDCTPDSTKIADGKINTKQDMAVDVTVKIGTADVTGKTTFKHTNCDGKQCGAPENGKFWLHVSTCTLTIEKTGGNVNEPYVFHVLKDGVKYTEVTIVGNSSVTICELPIGVYTIREDTGWSWRFTPGYGSAVTLSKANASGTIACSNRLSKPYWLNGFSTVVENVYGVQH